MRNVVRQCVHAAEIFRERIAPQHDRILDTPRGDVRTHRFPPVVVHGHTYHGEPGAGILLAQSDKPRRERNDLLSQNCGDKRWNRVNALNEALAASQSGTAGGDLEAVFEGQYKNVSRAIAVIIHDPGHAEELASKSF